MKTQTHTKNSTEQQYTITRVNTQNVYESDKHQIFNVITQSGYKQSRHPKSPKVHQIVHITLYIQSTYKQSIKQLTK